MPLSPIVSPEKRSTAEHYHSFGNILGAAVDFRITGEREPLYRGSQGRVVFHRHLVAIIRDRAIANGYHDNTIVAIALHKLGIPHAEAVPGSFGPKTHAGLLQHFNGLRTDIKKHGEPHAAARFIQHLDRLTPDTRDDAERRQIGRDLLWAVDIRIDYSDRLTETPPLAEVLVPALTEQRWKTSPYALFDFPAPKAYTSVQ